MPLTDLMTGCCAALRRLCEPMRPLKTRAMVVLVLACGATSASAQTMQCPTSVRLQVKAIAPVASDGNQGLIRGFGQVFSPRRVRLVGAWIGMVREDETVPAMPLEPDDLTAPLGRRAVYTLWNGAPPAPDGVVHLVCEYEAGLVLNKAVGGKIRRCELTTQLQGRASAASSKAAAKAPPKAPAKPPAKPAPGQKDAEDDDDAADVPTDTAQARPVVTRGTLSCR